ncbi:hypothetical protein HN51_053544 [Arachis hypogaea]|uniref:Early nodulin-like protein n=1 Tax=Arachis hypogaea TaxID=3818 RepID=A0A444XCG6_ARAHY|nr:early nodulin-like protein 1 [Arachis ipaensis]XP_025679842.1 early nodulin-like protein 1 [Arachis hypogaea]QHN75903.1 Early nodulin-like protein [Arachis hypogaea]RYQ87421.1 hypothetical protein Ahy_B09g094938 [Arachis hypogaea]
MASQHFGVVCSCMIMTMIIFLGASSAVEGARDFKVGDHLGWHEPGPNNISYYIQWAQMNRFQIGDSLVFEYQNDSVLVVEKWKYFHCDPNNPITSYDDGNSTVILDRSGFFYFISGTENHCHNGQKLIVEVISPQHMAIFRPAASPAPTEDASSSSELAPSPYYHHHYHGSNASSSTSRFMMIGSAFMALLVTFVVVLVLAP